MLRPLRPAARTASSSSDGRVTGDRLALGFGLDGSRPLPRLRPVRASASSARALLERPQRRRLGVSGGLLLGERVELARFGRDQEARLDDMRIGDAAPQALEQIAALGGDFARPFASRSPAPSQVGDLGDRLGLAVLVEVGLERAIDRQRLDQRRIIFARRIAHQGAHPAGMIDQGLQVVAAALAFRRVEDQAFEARLLEIIVERGIVLEIDFGAAASDLVERRLGNEEVAVLDQLRHLPIEEGQQQACGCARRRRRRRS